MTEVTIEHLHSCISRMVTAMGGEPTYSKICYVTALRKPIQAVQEAVKKVLGTYISPESIDIDRQTQPVDSSSVQGVLGQSLLRRRIVYRFLAAANDKCTHHSRRFRRFAFRFSFSTWIRTHQCSLKYHTRYVQKWITCNCCQCLLECNKE